MNYIKLSNDLSNTIKISRSFYNDYAQYDCNISEIFKEVVNFYIYLYNVKLVEDSEIRLDQKTFREKIIKRDKYCIISGMDEELCEAAHIIPRSINENYDIDNGILLRRDLHATFDLNYWSIDPETNKIIIRKDMVNNNRKMGNIINGNIVNINLTEDMKKYLIIRNKKIDLYINNT